MGAGGLTAEEMFGGLRYGKADRKEQVADWYGRLMRQLANDSSIAVANTLYVKEGYNVKRSFHDVATGSFQSEVHELNFAQNEAAAKAINNWVEKKTSNKIKDLIAPDMLDEFTRMVLVNAVHFKGTWKYQFNATNTRPMPFWLSDAKSQDIPMMYIKGRFGYKIIRDKGFSALQLSYSGSDTSMMVLLPNERNGLAALEEILPSLNLIELRKQLWRSEVELGMGRMFSNAAEFPDLLESNEPLKISKAIHKAFIEVNEEGTEAAAATAFSAKFRTAKAPSVMQFKADHPFIYALLSQDKGVYFLGKVTNPA
ncbi:serine protease inhibitor 4, serpin-4 [Anopheles darlingi]|uniref:Serine protease inhibitor 4, serpin-4 n=1 Tax=Anopheles darlingi TaxID=43151 RepID=W5JMT7_ANODA|nr:serine protease inhibitor 4, serpin-4 [Anopheles darlingi]